MYEHHFKGEVTNLRKKHQGWQNSQCIKNFHQNLKASIFLTLLSDICIYTSYDMTFVTSLNAGKHFFWKEFWGKNSQNWEVKI